MKKLLIASALVTGMMTGAPAMVHAADDMGTNLERAVGERNAQARDMEQNTSDTIIAKAMADEELSAFINALNAADLTESLEGEGPYTIFAPSNAAFEKIPEAELKDLLRPENKAKLQSVLKYHVVLGKITSTDIQTGATDVQTLQGETAKVMNTNGAVRIENAQVIEANVPASNGVIHVIDTVIMPDQPASQ